jgi:hypothetical protein
MPVHVAQPLATGPAWHMSETLEVLKRTRVAAVEVSRSTEFGLVELAGDAVNDPAADAQLDLWVCAKVP